MAFNIKMNRSLDNEDEQIHGRANESAQPWGWIMDEWVSFRLKNSFVPKKISIF